MRPKITKTQKKENVTDQPTDRWTKWVVKEGKRESYKQSGEATDKKQRK